MEEAFVIGIIDGDTILLKGKVFVRLIGIDAPEKNEPFYKEARKFLFEKLWRKKALLEPDFVKKDPYGRLLRYVWLNDELINVSLVEKGLAKVRVLRRNVKYKRLLDEAQGKAIEAKVGIWSKSYG